LIFAVIKLGLIEGYQFQDNHSDGKNISFVNIELETILHLVDEMELLGRQDIVEDLGTVLQTFVISTMSVIFFQFGKIQFYVALRT
jgi:hypothetical protein